MGLLEAIERTLQADPNIQIARSQVESSSGSAEIASSRFDSTVSVDLEATDSVVPDGENAREESRSYSETVVWNRELRSGQVLRPTVRLDQDSDAGVSTGTFSFVFRQPLMRGRRPEVVTAEERAAEVELEASRLDLLHSISERLLAVTNRYWSVRAAILDLEILTETEDRSRELLETTRRLVEADLTPAAELIQLEADLVAREAARIAGEQALFEAQRDLGAEIGLGSEEIETLGRPSDPFPRLDPEVIPENPRVFLAEAKLARADLAAERQRLTATEIRLVSTEDALKPQLDLVLTPSFTGLVAGDELGDALSALGRNVPGVSAEIGLSYAFPIENRRAEGALRQAAAGREQQALRVKSSEIRIGADVPSALEAVRNNAARLIKQERAVRLFAKTLENEEKKLGVGSSILIDVLNQRDRLTAAQQRLVTARLALAQSLVSLRFETGTLVSRRDLQDVQTVRSEDLTTLPSWGR